MQTARPLFKQVKAIALSVSDLARAQCFYSDTLGLSPVREADGQSGCMLGDVILLFKDDWYGRPTDAPNPRVTLEVDDALATEAILKAGGVNISDPVKRYEDALVGGFLDSEGNKLWFCSAVPAP